MKTIKIIDLISDLFDYRETQPNKLPKKIRFNGNEFNYKDKSYYDKNDFNFMRYINHTLDLRVEAEIVEEEKEIEKLDIDKNDIAWCEGNMKTDEEMVDIILNIKDKINELIDALNEIRKEK